MRNLFNSAAIENGKRRALLTLAVSCLVLLNGGFWGLCQKSVRAAKVATGIGFAAAAGAVCLCGYNVRRNQPQEAPVEPHNLKEIPHDECNVR
jgi:hypothetical protein